MTDLDVLEGLAKAAAGSTSEPWYTAANLAQWMGDEDGALTAAITPVVALDLISAAREREAEMERAVETVARRLIDERDAIARERDAMREALEWYGEQARLARLIHSEGDAGRNALATDGGNRARQALNQEQPA